MRKYAAQAAAATLPLMTTAIAMVVTPGYPVAAHATTILTSIIVALAAMLGIGLLMRDDPLSRPRWLLAAAWSFTAAIAVVAMMEAVILKPGGIDGHQWLPCAVLIGIAILASTERDGDRPDGFMVARAAATTALCIGVALALSLCIGAASGRLSGEDGITAMITLPFLILVLAPMVQAMRADDVLRARLGVAAMLLVYLLVVTSVGTYAWSPHYDANALGVSMFG